MSFLCFSKKQSGGVKNPLVRNKRSIVSKMHDLDPLTAVLSMIELLILLMSLQLLSDVVLKFVFGLIWLSKVLIAVVEPKLE